MFASHVVNNPDAQSQMDLLRSYGPSVPLHVQQRLVRAFDELRGLVHDGMLAYPFSIREQVAVVKHLQVAHPSALGVL